MLRTAMKDSVERFLASSGIAAIARAGRSAQRLILAYHNVVPDTDAGRGDLSLHLPRARFAEHLEVIRRYCDVVPLDAILEDGRETKRPRVAITFDDGYRGAVTLGVAELAARGLPATIFVVPGLVGGRTFWWDDLAGPNGEGLTPSIRAAALEGARGVDPEVRASTGWEGAPSDAAGPYLATATEEELLEAARVPGITMGSHTWSHPNLTKSSPAELRYELAEPLRWLCERFDAVVPWLSYPYGYSSAEVESAAVAAGYRAALRVAGGWLPPAAVRRYALPRLNVPAGLSGTGLELRLSGLIGRVMGRR